MNQLFCEIVSGQAECFKIAENDFFIAILDKAPITKGHTLLLPKRAILEWDELTNEEVLSLHCFIKETSALLKHRTGAHSVSIMQNGGKCNSIDYLHIHLIPRFNTISIWKDDLKDDTSLTEVFNLFRT